MNIDYLELLMKRGGGGYYGRGSGNFNQRYFRLGNLNQKILWVIAGGINLRISTRLK